MDAQTHRALVKQDRLIRMKEQWSWFEYAAWLQSLGLFGDAAEALSIAKGN